VLAHAELARDARDLAICSVPLLDRGRALGVLTLERSTGVVFDAATVEVCKAIGLALGPVLALKLDAQKTIWARLQAQSRSAAQAMFGPRHPGVKLIAMVAALLLLVLSVATGDYRVAARTLVEGAVQRATVAPFNGYVLESRARAGDVVRKGQLLARIDDKDLLLEQTRWSAEYAQLMGKHRQAFAAQDRASMQLLSAQLNQTQAQLSLVQSKLERADLRAAFDGVVVSGDLSQLLGTPVEQGKVLFEIAPLDDYRVILQVDERDIADLRSDQHGELALSGLPHQTLAFSVKQITPVTNTQDGLNHFRVEAHVEQASERLRPGMEGIGKVHIGQRRLIWIWSHSLLDWVRLALWRWMP
jgi:multidrug efflux pump subunit AcrA (membrane-fusion protein)